jgi:hypothetical protein
MHDRARVAFLAEPSVRIMRYGSITLQSAVDLTADTCVITLCRADGTVVAHFTRAADPQEVKRVAEEDLEERD